MEKVSYLGQPNCFRLSNGKIETIVTTDIGPRIIRYGFIGEENILGEVPEASVNTELGEWKPWGGHRLWVAPEEMPASYAPDNSPLEYETRTDSIRLTQHLADPLNLRKELTVTLDKRGSNLRLKHKLTNLGSTERELAPWALTIMRGGGTAILPQEPYRSHSEYLLPARPLVLWHYTDLNDPRWSIGPKYIRLKTDEQLTEPQKIGIANKQGWAAYQHARTLFVKRFGYQSGAAYPDYGSNNEVFTAASFIEVESLAPLTRLGPNESVEHVERWYLFNDVQWGDSETSLEAILTPLIAHTSEG